MWMKELQRWRLLHSIFLIRKERKGGIAKGTKAFAFFAIAPLRTLRIKKSIDIPLIQ